MTTAIAPAGANPFAVSRPAAMPGTPASAAADSDQQRQIAEVQAAIILARQFPRDQLQAMESILNACMRPTLAESALYSYSRGGSEVTGPSIRLAEAIAQEWGNIQFGIRELDQRPGVSTVEAFAWDVQRNVRQVKTFQVAHERHTRRGKTNLTDPRDIYELVANQGARRLRACILGVIPGDVIEAAVNQCETTMRASADTGPEMQKKLVEAFAGFGVSREQIEKKIQRRLDSITAAQVVALRKIHASLKDGMSTVDQWFETAATSSSATSGPAPAQLQQSAPAQAQLMPGEVIASAPATISAEQQAAINIAVQNLGITDLGLQTIAADLAQRGIDSVSNLPAEHFSWFMACLQDPAAVEHWQAGLSLDGDRLVEESPATPAAPEQPAAPAPAPAPATRQVVRRGKAKAEPQQPAEQQQAAPSEEPVQAELTAAADPDPFQGAG